jgi:hypothetical protein
VDEEPGSVVRGFWTVAAAGLVVAVTALSMRMNFEFGYGLGTSAATAQIFALLSVAFDGLKALLPLFAAWQWRDGRKLRAAAGLVLFVLVAAYGLASALGFASHNREGIAVSQENLNASLKEHIADLEAASGRLKALGPHRIGGVIEAEIAKLKKDRLWDATKSCNEATLAVSRDFCKRIEGLRAELATAAADAVLSAKIEGLKFNIAQLRARGAGREADPQLGEIARAAGLDILRVRSGMNWLLAIAVEAVSCFGLFAIAWAGAPRAAAILHAEEPAGSGKPWRLVNPKEARSVVTLLQPPVRKPKRSAARKTEQKKGNGAVPKALPGPRGDERPQTET